MREMDQSFTNWAYATLVGVLGASLCIAMGLHLQRNAEATEALAFEHLLDRRTADLQHTINEYKQNLQNTASLITAFGQDELTPERFRNYVDSLNLRKEFPGALGLAFARKVPLDKEAEFIQEMRMKGLRDFQIRFISPSSQDRFVMQYIEPIEENHSALGLDLGSENVRRENCLSAFSRAGLAVSKPITMIQNAHVGRLGFTMLMPVFNKAVPSSDLGARYEELVGWVSFPISIDRFLKAWLAQDQTLQLRISVLEEKQTPALFFDNVEPQNITLYPHAAASRDLQLGNRRWRLEFWPSKPDNSAPLNPVYLVLTLLGIALSGLAACKVKRMMDRYDELRLHKQLVDNSSEALIAEDTQGRILVWNHAAEELFGLDSASVLYDQEQNLTIPDELLNSEKRLHERAAQGETLKNIQTLRISDSAKRIHLRMNLAPIYSHNRKLVGYTKSFRDETEARIVWKDIHSLEELIAHAPDGVITLDRSRKIKLANPAALLLLQGANVKSTLIGQQLTELLAPDVLLEFENEVLNPLYKNSRVQVVFNWPVPGHVEHMPLFFRGFALTYPDLGESIWALRFEKTNKPYTPSYD
jgi:PAS domain S-box-containing protein